MTVLEIVFNLLWWLIYSGYFLHWNERRDCVVQIYDPLFQFFPRMDTSIPVMVLMYTSIYNFGINYMELDWRATMWSFSLLFLLRIFVLYLHPFKAHEEIIPLRDVITDYLLGVSKPLVNDLSFSGHVSFICLLSCLDSNWQYYCHCAFLCAVLMVCSRAHYTADCFIAPLFSKLAYENWTVIPSALGFL